MNYDDIAWCRRQFAMLADGGVWGVPRSGLVFMRRGRDLVLTQIMPHDQAMPMRLRELRRYQAKDYANIKRHFEAAGIKVRRDLGPR